MQIRDRIKKLKRIKAANLVPHPKNWRVHTQAQADALRGLLATIGYADALVGRELPDGRVQILDGHLRAETTPEMAVPVLIVDLNDEEAELLLATHDPVGAMAEADPAKLASLVADIDTESEAVRALLDQLLAANPMPPPPDDPDPPPPPEIPEQFCVLIECANEGQQKELLARLEGEGYRCRSLIS